MNFERDIGLGRELGDLTWLLQLHPVIRRIRLKISVGIGPGVRRV